jgi:hypothetical protein
MTHPICLVMKCVCMFFAPIMIAVGYFVYTECWPVYLRHCAEERRHMETVTYWNTQCRNPDIHKHYQAVHLDPCNHQHIVSSYDIMQHTQQDCWDLLPGELQLGMMYFLYILTGFIVIMFLLLQLMRRWEMNEMARKTLPRHGI